jgi:hypothetical protein
MLCGIKHATFANPRCCSLVFELWMRPVARMLGYNFQNGTQSRQSPVPQLRSRILDPTAPTQVTSGSIRLQAASCSRKRWITQFERQVRSHPSFLLQYQILPRTLAHLASHGLSYSHCDRLCSAQINRDGCQRSEILRFPRSETQAGHDQ